MRGKERKIKEEAAQNQKDDRREKATEEVVESKGNQLGFGAKILECEFVRTTGPNIEHKKDDEEAEFVNFVASTGVPDKENEFGELVDFKVPAYEKIEPEYVSFKAWTCEKENEDKNEEHQDLTGMTFTF